jgi:hypothetical protein
MPLLPVSSTEVGDAGEQMNVREEDEVRRKNRRMRYLEVHPEYLDDPAHELAGRFNLGLLHLFLPIRWRRPSAV